MKLSRQSLGTILWALAIILNILFQRSKPSVNRNEETHARENHQQVSAHQDGERAAVNPTITQPSSKNDQWREDQKGYWERQIRIAKWLNWITLGAAAAAGVALYFLSVQTSHLSVQTSIAKTTAQAAIDQLGMMKTSLQTTERAWVTIKSVTLEKPLTIGEVAVVFADAQNSGHSPAFEMTFSHRFIVLPGLPLGDMAVPNSTHGQSMGVMGPNAPTYSQNTVLITKDNMRELMSKQAFLYSYGVIRYVDIFRIKHWTTFCYELQSVTDLHLAPCSKWNDVDKTQADG